MAVPFIGVRPASAGVSVAPVPDFPTSTTVGETFPAQLTLLNASTPPESAQPVTLVDIKLVPGCTNSNPDCAGGIDPNVFVLSVTGTGSGACAGTNFVIAQSPPGVYTFTPSVPVVLGAGQSCTIAFMATTARVPSTDTAPGAPGVQTNVQATVRVTTPAVPGIQFTNTGIDAVTVVPAPATIATQASPQAVDPGEPFSDTATVTGVANGPTPTGTVTFQLFQRIPPAVPGGPATCGAAVGGPVAGSTLTATGPGSITAESTSPPFTAPVGDYVFVATYSGDANFVGPVISACSDDSERVTVNPLPTITVDKTATPEMLPEPGGDFTFNVLVTNTSNETVTITSLTDSVYGNLVGPPSIPPNRRGTSTCVLGATLAPDPDGPGGVTGGTYPCTFQGTFTGLFPAAETDTVTAVAVDADGNEATDSDDAVVSLTPSPPTVVVDKTATPLELPEPGGTFTFNVSVRNTSPRPVTITTLTDDIYGNIATQGTCTTAIGTVLAADPDGAAGLAPGGIYTCSFPGVFTDGDAGDAQTDVVTAMVVDTLGQTATDSDDATVTLTDVLPVIVVDKTATPLSLPEPGGTFTFDVTVTNPGIEDLTIQTLTDDIYGNIATQGTCTNAVGFVLTAGGGTYSCSFPGVFTDGNAGDAQTDTVTATATDNDGNTASDDDDATVSLTDVIPTVLVEKTASPPDLPEPGGDFTFDVVVTNLSNESVTITELSDDVFGDLATRGDCTDAIGTVLTRVPGPGNTYSCSFTAPFTGNAGDAETDTVTVVVEDDDGTPATDTDDAVVELTDVLPIIEVEKTADPVTRLEPGGTFTFTVVVTNNSVETVTIRTLTDDIYGDLATIAGSTCGPRIGTTLAPGASSQPCTFPGDFTGDPGDEQTDVVTATADDDDGNTATADDDATVTITNLVPDILVDKTATPDSLPEPGGTFTFNVTVTNTSIEDLTITELTDDIYGDLDTLGTCTNAIGAPLAANGGTYSCTFPGSFTGQDGDTQIDIVTATAVDDEGTTATDDDDAEVTITGLDPTVLVDKTVTPGTLPEPGGAFTYSVRVTNTSVETITIRSLNDSVYGNLATRTGSTCGTLIGTMLAPGAVSPVCTFTADFTGNAGDSETDIVTVVVTDEEGNEAEDDDDATVTLTDVPPTVTVDKTATPTTLPAPGGTFTFKVLVTNTGAEPVTITMLTDDVYEDIATLGTCTTAIGKVLAPGATYTCEFPGTFTGDGGDNQTDVVTVTVEDDDGTEAKDEDDAIVTITTVPPPPPAPPRVVDQQIVNPPRGVLARTGAVVAKLVTLAGGLILIGILLLIPSRWSPIGGGLIAGRLGSARTRRRRRR